MTIYPKINEAYKKLFNEEANASIKDWKIAEKILSRWDVPVLGEDLALETLFEIINHIIYPNIEITRRVVGRAENLISEFLPEFAPDNADAHMDYMAFAEHKYYEEKKAKEEREERLREEFDKEKKLR